MHLVNGLVIAAIVCIIMDVILNGIYSIFAQNASYFVILHPYSHLFKYIFLVTIFTFIFMRSGELWGLGKIFVPLLFLASLGGSAFVLSWYDAVSPDEIVQQRIWGKTTKSWDDVRVVITGGRISDFNEDGESEKTVQLEYILEFNDKSSINFWDDIDSLATLDNYVKERQMNISHTEVEPELVQELEEHIEGDVYEAKQILSIPEQPAY